MNGWWNVHVTNYEVGGSSEESLAQNWIITLRYLFFLFKFLFETQGILIVYWSYWSFIESISFSLDNFI